MDFKVHSGIQGVAWARFLAGVLCGVLVLSWAGVGLAQGAGRTAAADAKLDSVVIKELEFKNATVQDAVRIISELSGVSIVATGAAGREQVTFFVKNLSVADIVDSLCRIAGLWYRQSPKSGVYILMTADEYQKDIVVFRNEPTQMFKLRYLNVSIAAKTIADLFGERVMLDTKANTFEGDDFKIRTLDKNLTDNSDDTNSSSSDDTNDDSDSSSSQNSTSTNRNRSLQQSLRQGAAEKDTKLTTGQLSALEGLTKKDLQTVSEALFGQVAKRTEAPIYININRMHNILFVRTADEKAMEEIARVVRQSDLQAPEVLLEMKVLEVQLTDEFQSAFDISTISDGKQTGPDDGQAVNPLNSSASSVGSTLLGMGNSSLMSNPSMVFQALSGTLRARLQLLASKNNLRTLATPMLLAANNHPARLFIGQEMVLTTGFTSQQVQVSSGTNVIVNTVPLAETEVRSIGNTLTILPSINADRSVVMRIIHENSSVEADGGKIPVVVGTAVQNVAIDTVNTAKLEGTVMAQDGLTVAVGGMMRTTKSESNRRVPVLGDIPLLGMLFRDQQESEIKTELVLLITPHVLSAPEQGEAVTRRRLGELTEHPNGVDAYLDNLDKERLATGQASPPGPAAGAVSGLEMSFVDLVRVAVRQVRQPFLFRQPQGNVRPVSMGGTGAVPLFRSLGVQCTPVAAWENGFQHVTAVKVENATDVPLPLNVGDLFGDWRAATLENPALAPRGTAGSVTYLYLISDGSFDQSFSRRATP